METFVKGSDLVVGDELGVAFGYGIVCKENGEDYFDLQGDHIAEDVMLKASIEFMDKAQMMGTSHKVMDVGKAWVFPMTTEIAKALGITVKKTGMLVAVKPNEDVLKQIREGTFKGFSIGGSIIESEIV